MSDVRFVIRTQTALLLCYTDTEGVWRLLVKTASEWCFSTPELESSVNTRHADMVWYSNEWKVKNEMHVVSSVRIHLNHAFYGLILFITTVLSLSSFNVISVVMNAFESQNDKHVILIPQWTCEDICMQYELNTRLSALTQYHKYIERHACCFCW